MPDQKDFPELIPAHSGYRDLQSYQMSEIVYDASVAFCDRFISKRSRTNDQMVQAARSEKQKHAVGATKDRRQGCYFKNIAKKG